MIVRGHHYHGRFDNVHHEWHILSIGVYTAFEDVLYKMKRKGELEREKQIHNRQLWPLLSSEW